MSKAVQKWDVFEAVFAAEVGGNPYVDVQFDGLFRMGNRVVEVPGFYDGDGVFKVRFMPDVEGVWHYTLRANLPALDGQTGEFLCTANRAENHGPVRVANRHHFAYEDGTPYYQAGTTCYVWNQQEEALRNKTLETLQGTSFNKMRMCVFPKWFEYNHIEPEAYPFAGDRETGFDFTRFNPRAFAILEDCIEGLEKLGIEADIILFHPYDNGHWGFDTMGRDNDMRYLRYCIARLAAYHNVWWSFANEWDLLEDKTEEDWRQYGLYVQRADPYDHLRSIHNFVRFYDHSQAWVTHLSVQSSDFEQTPEWMRAYDKPIIVDECRYEGNVPARWGAIGGEEMTARFWAYLARGAYCGHGETYYNDREELWWSKGGELVGTSVAHIAFYREVLSRIPNRFEYIPFFLGKLRDGMGVKGEFYFFYNNTYQSAWHEVIIPEGEAYRVDVIDTWQMTITPGPVLQAGPQRIDVPQRQYIALLFTRTEAQ